MRPRPAPAVPRPLFEASFPTPLPVRWGWQAPERDRYGRQLSWACLHQNSGAATTTGVRSSTMRKAAGWVATWHVTWQVHAVPLVRCSSGWCQLCRGWLRSMIRRRGQPRPREGGHIPAAHHPARVDHGLHTRGVPGQPYPRKAVLSCHGIHRSLASTSEPKTTPLPIPRRLYAPDSRSSAAGFDSPVYRSGTCYHRSPWPGRPRRRQGN